MNTTKTMRSALATAFAAVVLASAMATSAAADTGGATGAGDASQTTNQYGPKGSPPPVGDSAVMAASGPVTTPDDGTFFYSMVGQDNVVADGARGYFSIAKPYLASADFHSLAELAVQDHDQNQIIEVGWTVDRGLNGDDEPHLFVFHWVDRQRTCYNGCGFVPVANVQGITAGMRLPVTATPTMFSILHHGTAWLVGFNGHTFGYFPDSLWGSRFKLTGLVQWFGEVDAAVGVTTSCTQMGNGEFAASPTAARIEKIGYWPDRVAVDTNDLATSPDLYTTLRTSSTGYRYGGPGVGCQTAPDLIGVPRTTAAHLITASGLVVGTVGTVVDPLCEDIDNVVSQTPAPGTILPLGSAVNFVYLIQPATGCPTPPK